MRYFLNVLRVTFTALLLASGSSAFAQGASLATPRATDVAAANSGDLRIKPPLGLAWGEKPARMEKLLAGAKATIVEKADSGTGEIWTVTGLKQSGLKHCLFEFNKQSLSRIRLVYQTADWTEDKYLDFFAQVKKRVTSRYDQATRETTEAGEEDGKVRWQEADWTRSGSQMRLCYLRNKADHRPDSLYVEYLGQIEPESQVTVPDHATRAAREGGDEKAKGGSR